MRGLPARILTAALLLPLVFVLIGLGPWGLASLLALFAVLGARELVGLFGTRGPVPPWWIVGGSAILMMVSYGRLLPLAVAGALVAVVAVAAAWEFVRRKGQMLNGLAVTTLGSIYLGLLPAHLLGYYDLGMAGGQDPRPAYYALTLVWGCDTAAFLVGSRIGRHRLWPRVSPSKSWEGALAGLLGAVVLAIGLGGWVPGLGLPGRIGAGLIVGIFAQAGDLAESMMKREADRKDSGRVLPGHGGVLDRLDSLIFAVPILYYWLRWLTTPTP